MIRLWPFALSVCILARHGVGWFARFVDINLVLAISRRR